MNHLGHVAKTIGPAKPYTTHGHAHEEIIHSIFRKNEDYKRKLPGKVADVLVSLRRLPGDDAYLSAAFESLIVHEYDKSVEVIAIIVNTLTEGRSTDCGALYPAALVGILRAADWLDKNAPATASGLLEALPSALGGMLVCYGSVAHQQKEREPSVQFVHEFGRALGTFLKATDNRTAVRRLRHFAIALKPLNPTGTAADGLIEEALGKIRSKLSQQGQAEIFAAYFEKLQQDDPL